MSNLSHRILLVVTEEIEIEFDDRWWWCCCCAKNMTMTAFFMRCCSLSLGFKLRVRVCSFLSLFLSLSLWRANLRDDDDESSSVITSYASRKRSSLKYLL